MSQLNFNFPPYFISFSLFWVKSLYNVLSIGVSVSSKVIGICYWIMSFPTYIIACLLRFPPHDKVHC